jgi:hypothetical protein
MSIQSNFPAISPSLLLDFANVQQLDPRITFTRASTATYYGTQTAKAEENLLLQSQDITTSWSTEGVTRTADTNTAPDGTATADTLTETTTTSAHRIDQAVSTSGTLTLSVFAKLGSGTRFLTIGVSRDLTHNSSATFDLSLGTNTQTQVNGGIYSSLSATITAVAQGFYRCTLTVTTDTATLVRVGLNNTGTPTTGNRGFGVSYAGDNTSSLILWGAQLELRSTVTAYTPTTTQIITNYIPQMLTAASGVARFDHNPTTFESLGLEIEESRTNLIIYSEQFQTNWTNERSSEQVDVIVSPAGTLTGDKLVEDTTATNSHLIFQGLSGLVSGSTLTFSVYIKAAERTSVRLQINDGGSTANAVLANFDASTGVASATQSTGTFTGASSTITPVGNGWYRCSISGVATGVTAVQCRIFLLSGGSSSYTGDGYSGLYIWGAQLEVGAFATSYIPTVASQVTRAADAASMTGTNFSSWYNQTQGTFYAQFRPLAADFGGNRNMFLATDGTANNFVGLRYASTGTQAALAATTLGVSQANIATGTMIAGTSYKIAGAYRFNDFAASRDLGVVGTDASGTLPAVTQAEIGILGGVSIGSQHIAKLAYYPLRVTNAQLQALTS